MPIDWNRLTPLAGLALAPWCWRLVAPLPAMRVGVGPVGLIAAGLLVVLAMGAGMLLHDNAWARRQRKVAPA